MFWQGNAVDVYPPAGVTADPPPTGELGEFTTRSIGTDRR